MLPGALAALKNRLEQRSSLTDEQRSLLAELRALDADPNVRVVITEELRRRIPATRIVSGPGSCDCCGR
jgi:hypothetical protein